MEHFQIIVYIIIGVIYIISRIIKATKPKVIVNPTSKIPENKTTTVNKPQPASLTIEEKKRLVELKAKKQQSLSVEKVVIPVENYENKPVEKSVDWNVDKNVEKNQGQFKPYAAEQVSTNPYIQLLKNPEGLKAAFVASEIMQRKYE